MSQPAYVEKSGEKLPQIRSIALVALGSNQALMKADVRETVAAAVRAIGETLGVIRGVSRFFRTPAFPPGSGPDFVNAALALETSLPPRELLEGLHAIEASFGRSRQTRWAARTLDLDLVGYDDLVLPDQNTFLNWVDLPLEQQMQVAPDTLVLPHPRLAERAFVLVPLAEVAADWRHPVTGKSVQQMLEALPGDSISEVVAL